MSLTIFDLPWLQQPPEDWSARCKAIGAGTEGAGQALQSLAQFRLDARQSLALARALERLRKADATAAPLSEFRLGILASNTADLLIDCLPAACVRHGVAVRIVSAPYDQVVQQALDPHSLINEAKPDAVLIAVDHRWFAFDGIGMSQAPEERIAEAMQRLRSVVQGVREHCGAPAILQTLPVPPHAVFGSYDRRMRDTPRALIDDCNRALVALAGETGSYLLDVAAMAERIGIDRWFDPVQWVFYKLPFAADCGPIYAEHAGRLLGAIRGKARKCLVLDLDNTLWGGVIGDDGVEGIKIGQGSPKGEAFLSVQRAARELRDRGIFLAVCSKNDAAVARRPFRDHPDMLLREEHISVFQANWLDKPSNLESIARALNIGLDSLVFLDDNPAERAQVRAALPMVAVPELPQDPSWYSWTLSAAGYFEVVTFSAEDRSRAEAVLSDGRRAEVLAKSRDLGDYLSSLEMVIGFSPFDAAGRQRITQLINKTNQFNLTTRRYTEFEVAAAEADAANFTLQVRLKDKFGDLGMIAVVICRSSAEAGGDWNIDTWLMSCRVLGRDVERAMLARVVQEARRRGVARLIGTYIPTQKNGMVAGHYGKLGFTAAATGPDGQTNWVLDIAGFAMPNLPMQVVDGDGGGADAAVAELFISKDGAVDRALANALSAKLLGGEKPDPEDLPSVLKALLGDPLSMNGNIDHAASCFQDAGRTGELLEFLLKPGSAMFTRLPLVAKAGRLARTAGRFDQFKARVDAFIAGKPVIRYQYAELLIRVAGSDDAELRDLLFAYKHGGLANVGNPDKLVEHGAAIGPRIAINRAALDHLFARRRNSDVSRRDWDSHVRTSYGVDVLIHDLDLTAQQQLALVDAREALVALRKLDQRNGAVVLVGHAGFASVRLLFARQKFRRMALVALGGGKGSNFDAGKDPRAALFAGLKALMAKKMLLIAPDGPHGVKNTTITVLGRQARIADGAAFLAYEGKCPSYWFGMGRRGEKFVPSIVPGPQRGATESFAEFRLRLVAFYEEMLNDYFSGDPQDLVVTPNWWNVFAAPS